MLVLKTGAYMPLSETVGRTRQDAKTYSLPHPIVLKFLLIDNR